MGSVTALALNKDAEAWLPTPQDFDKRVRTGKQEAIPRTPVGARALTHPVPRGKLTVASVPERGRVIRNGAPAPAS